jgi:hypothetical protein
VDFDDALWASGAAPLGYGNGDEVTTVNYGPDPANKFITTYFRHVFDLAPVGPLSEVGLRLSRDDGAVVYLNGMEVFRSNMPEGSINYLTEALEAIGGEDEQRYYRIDLDPALFSLGRNVLAVEVHQANPNSSDLRFDLELAGVPGEVIAPALALRRTGPRMLILWPTTPEGYRLESTARLEPDSWTPVTNSIQVLNNTNTFYELLIRSPRFYRLRKP